MHNLRPFWTSLLACVICSATKASRMCWHWACGALQLLKHVDEVRSSFPFTAGVGFHMWTYWSSSSDRHDSMDTHLEEVVNIWQAICPSLISWRWLQAHHIACHAWSLVWQWISTDQRGSVRPGQGHVEESREASAGWAQAIAYFKQLRRPCLESSSNFLQDGHKLLGVFHTHCKRQKNTTITMKTAVLKSDIICSSTRHTDSTFTYCCSHTIVANTIVRLLS